MTCRSAKGFKCILSFFDKLKQMSMFAKNNIVPGEIVLLGHILLDIALSFFNLSSSR